MHLGLRLLFGFFVVAGATAFLLLRVFLVEVKPSVREVMEDVLVDSANLLAEAAAPDLRAMPAGGTLEGTRFAASVADYAARPIDARIWGLAKRTLDLRITVTDAAGRVVFAAGGRDAVGADHSRWRDVALTLRGEYGARVTRDVAGDDRSAVMIVAAPIRDAGRIIGTLAVAKPMVTVQPFIDRAERKVAVAGAWLLAISLGVGLAVTLWTVHSVRRLRRYAQQASAGQTLAPPALPGELGELAQAMGQMRDRLGRRDQVEQSMRALTHELKSPLTAIRGAAELLAEPLPERDRERFAGQIGEQVQRLQGLVERLLELSRLEALPALDLDAAVDLRALAHAQAEAMAPRLAQRSLRWQWLHDDAAAVRGDAEQIALALSNLVANALDFAPDGTALDIGVAREGRDAVFTLRDRGPGVPDYALARLGERFFSTPRPRDSARGSGLGLAIVKRVVQLHGGRVSFRPAQPGLFVELRLPAA